VRILTDCRDLLADFVPKHTVWQETEAGYLCGPERVLWRALGSGGRLWAARAEDRRGRTFWRRAIIVGTAPRSQFDVLNGLLDEGLTLDGPTAVLALGGHEFRGYRGRSWCAAPGNLFLTVGLPVGLPAASTLASLIMLPAVAVLEAVRPAIGDEAVVAVKWVNDILIDGRKVGGVLTATHCLADEIQAAVVGIGVNVKCAPQVEPTPFVPEAGCLAQTGVQVSLHDFFWNVLATLADCYQGLCDCGPADLLRAYRGASCVVGERVRVWREDANLGSDPEGWPQPIAGGVVRAIEPDLSLRIEGCEEQVYSGRLAFDEACRALAECRLKPDESRHRATPERTLSCQVEVPC